MYKSVQYLRGLAATAVVFKHAAHPPYEHVLGYGVDLFFVISGFVMVVSTSGRDIGVAKFLTKRAKRVLPIWWVALFVVWLAGVGRGDPLDWLSSALLIPYDLETGYGIVSWGVGWTLVFEAIFYLLFGLTLWLRRPVLLPILLLALVAYGFVIGRPAIPVLNDATHPLLLEFLFGVAIGSWVVAGRTLPTWLAPTGLLLFIFCVFLPDSGEVRPFSAGLPLAMTMAGMIAYEQKNRIADVRVLHFVGDASYSIYLFHYVPILLLAGRLPWPALAIAGLGAGVIAYLCVERPLLVAMRPRHIAAGTGAATPGP
ncbi:acyltransferase [Sphingorhabdus soli]|uniref:Acyltransferase n=1 Tax=Flavisphingopyxis soli TaxID=2601267 RepID=A0A5C6UL52_9SPHN|nr:acyltransferase [Sphingorhabdus soli]TXC73922.1 acyltransferase [Sphingorhabdus soli]